MIYLLLSTDPACGDIHSNIIQTNVCSEILFSKEARENFPASMHLKKNL